MARYAVTLALTAAVLWLAGEQHRENCIRQDRTSCSVLPWDSGKAAPTEARFDTPQVDWRRAAGD